MLCNQCKCFVKKILYLLFCRKPCRWQIWRWKSKVEDPVVHPWFGYDTTNCVEWKWHQRRRSLAEGNSRVFSSEEHDQQFHQLHSAQHRIGQRQTYPVNAQIFNLCHKQSSDCESLQKHQTVPVWSQELPGEDRRGKLSPCCARREGKGWLIHFLTHLRIQELKWVVCTLMIDCTISFLCLKTHHVKFQLMHHRGKRTRKT